MDIKNLYLFQNLNATEIEKSLHCSQSQVMEYEKGSFIFHQEEKPQWLYLILSGIILVGQTNSVGRRLYAEYLYEGNSFGETDLFLQRPKYDFYSIAKTKVTLLVVSRHFFAGVCSHNCPHHGKIIFNMLHIFAEATQRNATKIQLLTSGTLRGRTSYYLYSLSRGQKYVELPLNREELAIYLNTARPSLSRELSNMQRDGLIKLSGRKGVEILNFELLELEFES